MTLATRLSLSTVILVGLTALGVSIAVQARLEPAVIPNQLANLQVETEARASTFDAHAAAVRSLLAGLRDDPTLEEYAALAVSAPDSEAAVTLRERLGRAYLAQLRAHEDLLQIRLIGRAEAGKELVRVERTRYVEARLVPEGELQIKGHRDYFREALETPPGEIYVSTVSLNRERGAIEQPYTPVLRLASALATPEGEVYGALVVNLDLTAILARLRRQAHPGGHLYIWDQRGQWLLHPEPGREFLLDRELPTDEDPALPPALLRELGAGTTKARVLEAPDGTRGVAAVRLRLASGPSLVVVHVLPEAILGLPLQQLRQTALLSALFAALCGVVLAMVVARGLTRPLKKITAVASEMARGARETSRLPVDAAGEIGILARGFAAMAREVEERAATLREEVSQRRKAQEKLEHHAAIVASTHDAIVTAAADGTIMSWNPGAEELLGFSVREIVGRPLDTIVPGGAREQQAALDARLAAGGAVTPLETSLRHRDGHEVAVSLSVSPLLDADGASIGFARIARDISARKAAEERLRLAVDASPAGIIISDAEGRMVMVNSEVERLFGYEPGSMIDRSIDDLVPVRFREHHASLRAGYRAAPERRALGHGRELLAVRADGSEFPAEIGLTPLPSQDGLSVLTAIVDISARKRAEAEAARMRRKAAEARAREAELTLENRQISEANRLKSEFLANMSHELRTPLNAIIGFAELLYDERVDIDPSRYREFHGDILSSGRHLLRLINDVLDLAKVEAGKLQLRPEEVQPDALVGEVVGILRTTATRKDIAVEMEIDPELGALFVDPFRVRQVIYNFLSNALKFTERGGRVKVRIRAEGPELFRIEVEDDGIGIAPGDKRRVFWHFQQLDAGLRKRHEGTGLGLALTRRLVEALDGTVGVRDAEPRGSIFHCILPRRQRGNVSAAGGSSLVRQIDLRARRILVVEDSPEDQRLLIDTLTEAGYAVELATTCEAARGRVLTSAFDAILLDLLLPDSHGLALVPTIRSSIHNRHTPVIVVSVAAEQAATTHFPLHDVIPKPLRTDKLLDSLECAGLSSDTAGSILVVDDDPKALELMRTTLAGLGYGNVVCRSSGAAGLEALEAIQPAGVILDLLMPEIDGFEFLRRMRKLPKARVTPVLVWTMHDLTAEEHKELRASALSVVAKGAEGDELLLDTLRACLPANDSAAR